MAKKNDDILTESEHLARAIGKKVSLKALLAMLGACGVISVGGGAGGNVVVDRLSHRTVATSADVERIMRNIASEQANLRRATDNQQSTFLSFTTESSEDRKRLHSQIESHESAQTKQMDAIRDDIQKMSDNMYKRFDALTLRIDNKLDGRVRSDATVPQKTDVPLAPEG
jgi:hypothetical protein